MYELLGNIAFYSPLIINPKKLIKNPEICSDGHRRIFHYIYHCNIYIIDLVNEPFPMTLSKYLTQFKPADFLWSTKLCLLQFAFMKARMHKSSLFIEGKTTKFLTSIGMSLRISNIFNAWFTLPPVWKSCVIASFIFSPVFQFRDIHLWISAIGVI